MNAPWGYASLALYFASFLCYAHFLYGNERWVGRLATLALAAGIYLHYVALLERSRFIHSVPYDDLYGVYRDLVSTLGADGSPLKRLSALRQRVSDRPSRPLSVSSDPSTRSPQ